MPSPRTEPRRGARTGAGVALAALLAAVAGGCGRSDTPAVGERGGAPGVVAAPPPPTERRAGHDEDDLVVHEWGTFTSMVAPDGTLLSGMHHSDEALPDFVASAPTQLAAESDGYTHEATQRMETPVLYLYAARALDVTVEVTFPFGLMSEWYPEVAELRPHAPAVERIADGALRWEVRIEPGAAASLLAPVGEDSVWAPSRRVAAPLLRPRRQRAPSGGAAQWERLLFYRGIGDFDLPAQLRERAGGFEVAFGGQRPVAAAWLLTVDGDRAGLRALGELRPGHARRVDDLRADLPLEQAVTIASTSLQAELRRAGLFDDEAKAMVDTWRQVWLRTPGTRLLYLLPRRWTDALLPLRVRPRPRQIERVMVGRIALLRQQTVDADAAALGALAADGASANAAARAWQLAGALQPFAEPRLRWLCQHERAEPRRELCRRALRWAHRR